MKKFLTSIILFLFVIQSFSQVKNINPDPSGEPWFVGGLRVPDEKELNAIPKLQYPENYKLKTDLPVSLDNSTQPYFRPVFSQTNGSCGQASGVAYNFTYEYNYVNQTSANTSSNQFPTHYTYNFLNEADGDNGSWYIDGWNIIKANGCPTVATYGGIAPYGETHWMTGYSNYQNSMKYRTLEYFAIDVSTPDGLNMLKNWMFDRLDGSPVGGIVNFAAGVSDYFSMTYSGIIYHWGHNVNHAMTFVGWDDNIKYDFNGDGLYTNDIDINGDQIVDMRDWENGALIMVNSWGTTWGNSGKAYVMYKLLAENYSNGGILSGVVHSLKVKNNVQPTLLMKVKITHNSRNKISIKAGIANNLNATVPEHILSFPLFDFQGGSYNMLGYSTQPIEICLDISTLLNYTVSGNDAKYFLQITEQDPNNLYSGQVYDYSVLNPLTNQEFACSSHNVAIVNNSETVLGVSANISFESPQIASASFPTAVVNQSYSYQLAAQGGTAPYVWAVKLDYSEQALSSAMPSKPVTALIPSDNDDGIAPINLNFEFPFFGKTYSNLYVSTDGAILFENAFSYIRDETSIKASKVIGVFSSDLMLYSGTDDGIFFLSEQNCATIYWKTSLFENEDVDVNVAVKLFSDGKIEFYYRMVSDGLDWASGISNGDGTNFVISQYSGNNNPDNLKTSFTTSPYPIGMELTSDGVFQGIPATSGEWVISFVVTDYNNISKSGSLVFTSLTSDICKEKVSLPVVCVYPNPSKDFVNFQFCSISDTPYNLEIFDISGKLIYSVSGKTHSNDEATISWKPKNNQCKGLYIYKLSNGTTFFSGKLFLE